MKKLIIPMLLLCAACTNTTQQSETTKSDSIKTSKTKPEESCNGMLQHNITFDEALRLLSNYMASPVFDNNHFAGGYLPKENLTVPEAQEDLTSGLVFYFCYAGSGQVFLAYRMVDNFNYDKTYFSDNFKDTDEFLVSNGITETTAFPSAATRDELIIYLKTNNYTVATNTSSISFLQVKQQNELFNNTFRNCRSDFATTDIICNEAPYGFFDGHEIDCLLKQESEVNGARFYFGYDKTETENKIRVVLFPGMPDAVTTGKTKNLVTLPIGNSPTEYARLLERHWPPY